MVRNIATNFFSSYSIAVPGAVNVDRKIRENEFLVHSFLRLRSGQAPWFVVHSSYIAGKNGVFKRNYQLSIKHSGGENSINKSKIKKKNGKMD